MIDAEVEPAIIAPFLPSRPRKLGRVTLIRRIAVGGMGEVFLARQESELHNFGRIVTAKLLLESFSQDPSFVDMFLEEAKVVAQLNHPNILQVHDVGGDNDRYYIVMEYLPGQTLTEIMNVLSTKGSYLPARLACESLSLVADALHHAHDAGLVHRDVSLSNIMFTDHGAVKLIDFGIARGASRASFTTPGVLKGKIGYMAPEYLRGNEYDHRSDLYSLGIVLYEVLSGRRLFKSLSAVASMQRILNERILPLHEANAAVPKAVSDVVMRALARDPEQRFASGQEMAEALRDAAADLPSEKSASTLVRWLEQNFAEEVAARTELLRRAQSMEAAPELEWKGSDTGRRLGEHELDALSVQLELPDPFPRSFKPRKSALPLPEESSAVASPGAWGRVLVVAGTAALCVFGSMFLLGSRSHASPVVVQPVAAPITVPAPSPSQPAPPPPDGEACERNRRAGIDAIATSRYDAAVTEFAAAMRARCADGDLPELLRSAKEMSEHERTRASARYDLAPAHRVSMKYADPVPAPTAPVVQPLAAALPPRTLDVPRPSSTELNPKGGTAPRRKIDTTNPYGAQP